MKIKKVVYEKFAEDFVQFIKDNEDILKELARK